MKKLILALLLLTATTSIYAQWTPLDGVEFKRPLPIDRAENNGMRRVLGTSSPAYLPHTGTPHILTILVNFADSAISVKDPKEAFTEFFNATDAITDRGNGNALNHGSVAKYFSDMSNGAFEPVFDVYGPVTVSKKMAEYGGSNRYGNDENPSTLVADALAQITDQLTDASVFDSNNDGYIDCVYIIYAGPGQNNGGGFNTVWAKTGQASGTFIGKQVGWYSMAGELTPAKVKQLDKNQPDNNNNLITGIGVTCHELSHAMGLPDIYPTASSARADNQEMEYWDLMDGGEYVNNGYCPAAYTAWEKNLMGWNITINTLSESTDVTMDKSTEESGVAYKIANKENANEYFLLENIQKTAWNTYMPGQGLLVYHVNEEGNTTINTNTHLNNTNGKPGLAVVPADGACLSSYLVDKDAKDGELRSYSNYRASHKGDPFPGTSNVTALNDDCGLPNFYWYYGTNPDAKIAAADGNTYHKVNVALSNITEADGKVSFSYVADYATGIKDINNDSIKSASLRIYSLTGAYLGTDLNALPRGIYIVGGRKIIK